MNPRPIQDVITAILTQVPREFPNREAFETMCASIIESAKYSAPEAMSIHWDNLAEACRSCFACYFQEQFAWTIGQILSTQLDYRDFLPMEIP